MKGGNSYDTGVAPVSTAKAAGSRIVDSRLNSNGSTYWKGSRGKYAKGMMKGGMGSSKNSKKMSY
ncbi:hypothetical protein LCGC14_2523950 [marine sediment metagenome]|uniref:Uncharacterized protein n=1 Tax=marine sediment metagenome TaxID=412755 RepID=A0A0F9AVL4_9ZZZZ